MPALDTYNPRALTRTVALLVTLLVIAGTSAAFAVSEKLKVERAPIGGARVEPRSLRFSPTCSCPTSSMQLSFRFRRAAKVDVTIVNGAGQTVRTLAEGQALRRGRHAFEWDGRTNAGMVAPDGTYRLRIHFKRERRSILVPIPFQLDTKPPRVHATATPLVISPDRDGRNDRVTLTYRTNEKGTVELTVDGDVLKTKRAGPPRVRHTLYWGGRVPVGTAGSGSTSSKNRVPATAGTYELVLTVRDVAGNVAEVHFTIRVRYIELTQAAYQTKTGGQLEFEVDTDAAAFSWSLSRTRSAGLGRALLQDQNVTGRSVSVVIPADFRPGTYVLRVEANGHSATAPVAVSGGSR